MFCLIDEDIQNIEWLSVTLVFIARGAVNIGFFVIYIYLSEYYPTQVRNTAIGLAAAVSRIGGILSTYVSTMDQISYSFYLFGLAAIAGGIASMKLDKETTGLELNVTNNKKKTRKTRDDRQDPLL